MIYLDNSATTFPKSPQVSMAMSRAMTKFGANPGRSGHATVSYTHLDVYKRQHHHKMRRNITRTTEKHVLLRRN